MALFRERAAVKTIVMILGSALVATSAAAQNAPTTFDLICEGSARRTVESQEGKKEEVIAWAERYAVDLDRRLYCVEGCDAPSVIRSVSPGVLHLRNDRRETAFDSIVLDRVKGEVQRIRLYAEGDSVISFSGTGQCQRGRFTTFPSTRF